MTIVSKPDWSKLHIAKVNGWVVSAIGDQHLLGGLIIFPPRKIVGSLVELSDSELVEFKQVAQLCEQLLKKAFSAEWFNYVQAGNVVKNLHIQLWPRYSSSREFFNHTFTDGGWGGPLIYLPEDQLVPAEKVFGIVEFLKSELSNLPTNLKVEIIK